MAQVSSWPPASVWPVGKDRLPQVRFQAHFPHPLPSLNSLCQKLIINFVTSQANGGLKSGPLAPSGFEVHPSALPLAITPVVLGDG